jgi:hypothetical protein
MIMTSPAVIELPRRLEPVSRDTFLDEPATGEERAGPGDEERADLVTSG